jgi:hypothetical protein
MAGVNYDMHAALQGISEQSITTCIPKNWHLEAKWLG